MYSIPNFIKESYATFVGWHTGEHYYISIGWDKVDPEDVYIDDDQTWPYGMNSLLEGVHLDYTPLFIDLVDDHNQITDHNLICYVNDDIQDVPYAVIERIAMETNDWASCKRILRENLGKYRPLYGTLPNGGVVTIMVPYYTEDQLNRMFTLYDQYFSN